MSKPRIGEMLRKLTHMCPMDVEEILQDQTITGRKFGEIALSWGLCEPQHVWNAWYAQLGDQPPLIDLNDFGVDSQAVARVSRDIAMKWNLIPLRIAGDHLVIAVADDANTSSLEELFNRLNINVRFVRAKANQITAAIEIYYGSLCSPA